MLIEISVLPHLLSSLLPYLATSDPFQHNFGMRAEIWAGGLTCQELWVKYFSEADLPLQDWGKKSYSPMLLSPCPLPTSATRGIKELPHSQEPRLLEGRPEVGLETLISRYIEPKNITPTAATLFPKGRSCTISRERDIKVRGWRTLGVHPQLPLQLNTVCHLHCQHNVVLIYMF